MLFTSGYIVFVERVSTFLSKIYAPNYPQTHWKNRSFDHWRLVLAGLMATDCISIGNPFDLRWFKSLGALFRAFASFRICQITLHIMPQWRNNLLRSYAIIVYLFAAFLVPALWGISSLSVHLINKARASFFRRTTFTPGPWEAMWSY